MGSLSKIRCLDVFIMTFDTGVVLPNFVYCPACLVRCFLLIFWNAFAFQVVVEWGCFRSNYVLFCLIFHVTSSFAESQWYRLGWCEIYDWVTAFYTIRPRSHNAKGLPMSEHNYYISTLADPTLLVPCYLVSWSFLYVAYYYWLFQWWLWKYFSYPCIAATNLFRVCD